MSVTKESSRVRAAQIGIQILLPFIIVLTSIFLVLVTAKFWVSIEYRMPGFPEDRFGFTLQDRLYWSSVDIDYLLSNKSLDYFDAFFLPDGSPMHNERELRHMEDVNLLLQSSIRVWIVGWALLLVLSVLLWRAGAKQAVLQGLVSGSKLTLILMAVLALGTLLAFGALFVGFHRLFFEGTTWLFPYTDTFIRLYPERFWRDAFIFLAIVNVLVATSVFFVSRRVLNKTLEQP
ncbi:MAG: TIGR01906 family membrane protein [Anaerolineales bacterium]|nr:TIGR01906 family membrane protein [Anaerolineales bacterium]